MLRPVTYFNKTSTFKRLEFDDFVSWDRDLTIFVKLTGAKIVTSKLSIPNEGAEEDEEEGSKISQRDITIKVAHDVLDVTKSVFLNKSDVCDELYCALDMMINTSGKETTIYDFFINKDKMRTRLP